MNARHADRASDGLRPARRAGDGIAESTRREREAVTAPEEDAAGEGSRLMDEVVRRENLVAAYTRVVRNGGAAGVDGMGVEALAGHLRAHGSRIREALLSGQYQPQPVRRVEIAKPGGRGVRQLGIPTVVDRLIQQALRQVLTPVFDPTFSEASYGFRPGRSAQQAVIRAREMVAAGYTWVVDLDLEKFFDRVNHDVLMSRVARWVKDRRVLRVIRSYLQSGIMEGGVVSVRREGTPQGGPLSPLLSNILLDDLDKELERRGHCFVRYADDCNVYVRSQAAGERVMDSLERFLEQRLRLRVNREKSAVARPWERKFLGYSVTSQAEPKLKVAPESVKRLREKLKRVFRLGRGNTLPRTIAALTPLIRGWVAYFRWVEVERDFVRLDSWLRHRLRVLLWRHWRNPATRVQELRKRGLSRRLAEQYADNGRGPWWNAGARHMNLAVPTRMLRQLGLVSFVQEHRRLAGCS